MTVVRGGATRVHHCRGCRAETRQRLLLSENGYPQGRHVETYRCEGCGGKFLSMGEGSSAVPDAEGLVVWVIGEWRRNRRAGTDSGYSAKAGAESDRWLDLDDLHLHLFAQMVVIWAKWDPGRGVPFRAYATGELRHDLQDWLRSQLGRDRPKPFANAIALDDLDSSVDASGSAGRQHESGGHEGAERGDGLEALVGGALDADTDWEIDLERLVVQRHSDLAELDRKYGVVPDA